MPSPMPWPTSFEQGSLHFLRGADQCLVLARWDNGTWHTIPYGQLDHEWCLHSDMSYSSPQLSAAPSADAFAATAIRATGGEGVYTAAEIVAAMNRKMMRVEIFDTNGKHAGNVAIPADVMEGAALVSRWLRQQHGAAELHGLVLADRRRDGGR